MRRFLKTWDLKRAAASFPNAVLPVGASLLVPVFAALALGLPAGAIERIAAPVLGPSGAVARLLTPPADPQGSQSMRGRSPVSGSRGPTAPGDKDGRVSPDLELVTGALNGDDLGSVGDGSGPILAPALPPPVAPEEPGSDPDPSAPASSDPPSSAPGSPSCGA